MIVLDSSVVLASLLPDEEVQEANALFRLFCSGALDVVVPTLFYLEVINVLGIQVRRQRITEELRVNYLNTIMDMPFKIDVEAAYPTSIPRIKMLMDDYGLTAYDACYLDLSKRLAIPLATLDKALRRAAANEGMLFKGGEYEHQSC